MRPRVHTDSVSNCWLTRSGKLVVRSSDRPIRLPPGLPSAPGLPDRLRALPPQDVDQGLRALGVPIKLCPKPVEVAVVEEGLQHQGFVEASKYPPAEPGALICEPLKAADGVANAAPRFGATYRWLAISTGRAGPTARLPSPGCGCTRGSPSRRDPPSRRSIPAPRSAAPRSSSSFLRTLVPGESRSCL